MRKGVMPEIDRLVELNEKGGTREVPDKYLPIACWSAPTWQDMALHPRAIRLYSKVA